MPPPSRRQDAEARQVRAIGIDLRCHFSAVVGTHANPLVAGCRRPARNGHQLDRETLLPSAARCSTLEGTPRLGHQPMASALEGDVHGQLFEDLPRARRSGVRAVLRPAMGWSAMTVDHNATRTNLWIRHESRTELDQPPRDPVAPGGPTPLQRLRVEHGQSPWLDGLSRSDLRGGSLAGLVAEGIRGVTANPTTFATAIEDSSDYDDQFAWLRSAGCSAEEAYWELVITDTIAACDLLHPVHRATHGSDGFVSVEVAPDLADDTGRTIAAARNLHRRIDRTNLMVKVPATPQGVAAIQALIAGGRNTNVTLLFSLARYAEVIEAYLSGLEAFISRGGDPAKVHSVASFFVGRVDAEVDVRLKARGDRYAGTLGRRAGVAQAKLAYQLFRDRFSGKRWERLANHGAHPQLPLWASTSPKDPADRDTRYVEELIGPQTVSTLPVGTVRAFQDHGRLARTIDSGVEQASDLMQRLSDAGIDMDDVGLTLEHRGIAGFAYSLQKVLDGLDSKRQRLGCP
jgi:transaldolase